MIRHLCLVGLALVLGMGGCVSVSETGNSRLDQDLSEITRLLVGDYFSHSDDGARAGRPIYLRIRTIAAPDGHMYALYSEMRHDGPHGPFYRQVIYLFDETPTRTENRMTALRVADSDAASKLVSDPDLYAAGAVSTYPALSPDCYAVWTKNAVGFEYWIDPARCVITGKRGDQRRIEARTEITATSIGQLERGFSLDGDLLFGNPSDALYVWPRLVPTASD